MKYPQYTNRQVDIPYLLKIGEGKIAKLGKYLYDKDMGAIALFLGAGMEKMLGPALDESLQKFAVKVLHRQEVAEIAAESVMQTAFALPPQVKAIVGAGGGKALDFAKYAAHLLKLPFISVPTSASNDGFCSPGVSLTVAGRRKTLKASVPYGVVIDLGVVGSSPPICLYSGIGDMVSKISALWDWKEAFNRGLERYNDFASVLSYSSLDLLFLKHSRNIAAPQFLRSLMTSLLYSGIAMEIAGTSRPASGSEHLISHALDEVAKVPQMHGLQTGTACYLCCLLQNNEAADAVRDILCCTGFVNEVAKHPFNRSEFLQALKLAPQIKDNFYTILSDKGSLSRAQTLLDKDAILQKMII